MINQIGQSSFYIKKQSFKGSENNNLNPNKNFELNAADKFLKDVEKISQKKTKDTAISKFFGTTTALLAAAVPLLGYEFGTLFYVSRLRKLEKHVKADKISKSFIKNLAIVSAGCAALYAGLNYYFNSKTDRNFEKLKKEFQKANTLTDANLAGTFKSGLEGAYCSSGTGNIRVNRNIMNDPIWGKNMNKLIRHELVHAKQFEMVARSKDGIKKLNFATFASIRNLAQKDPNIKNEFIQIFNDVQNDTTGKYDNVMIDINGDYYNFKKYITLVHTLLTKENVTYNDLPVIIDTKHYNKVIESKGKLSDEEEKKAQEYYEALTNYTNITLLNAFNPFGGYRNNILEQEAYQENPSFFMKLFGKN